MYVEMSAKRPVARRDKARHAVSARHRALPEGLVVSGSAHRAACLGASQAGATQHPLRTAGGQRISSQHA
ncbi:hypothetical protein DB811_03105 [Xanthomonas perforans]|uniref:Uncharacterized protein n=1 Tax=Xanthomonas perforans TaxID=442694 RepID=A0AAQ1BVK7_XANPE|nr:hypothetical protein BJD13_19760 [Xanthomonas perforans]AQS77444.1 hypothetical protein XPE_15390 [Xanthomonas perforans 91-118]RXD35520.1 hypothetical protein DB854_12965 [Xanthomonas perforans]RXD41580.1 hypothetical protein DB757_09775 [Xanthomonas perforans]RXD52615.1 hypothetical protein DB769_14705 [Xanthomonas perforans]